MLLFLVTAAALAALIYFLFRDGGDASEGAGAPKRPTSRPRDAGRRTSANGPDVHEKKVRKNAREAYQTALARARDAGAGADMNALAKESYVLAESLQKMFASDQFFEGRPRFDSFRTALQAAEDARDTLVERQKKALRETDVALPPATGHVENQYATRAVESALMIAWCAGGLLGKSRLESAQAAFRVPVSAEDVRRWDQFGQVLRKESKHHKVEGPEGEPRVSHSGRS